LQAAQLRVSLGNLLQLLSLSAGSSPVYPFYSFENGQMNLAFESSHALTQRFVWGPQVDQLWSDELDSASYGSGEIYYPLADQQQTIHDAAKYISSASATKVVVHRYLDAYGSGGWWTNFESSSYDGSLSIYTGRFTDNLTGPGTARLGENRCRTAAISPT
jgi:hypothetical protein